jgi:aryl-alcohol dehydrogenase-like predicted oxidoreductase
MYTSKSRVVLGGHSVSNMSVEEFEELITFAVSNGVCEIDSAPSYPKLEVLLGKVLRSGAQIKINSKVGLPTQESFIEGAILKQVEESLRTIVLKNFETIFVHSVPYSKFKTTYLKS